MQIGDWFIVSSSEVSFKCYEAPILRNITEAALREFLTNNLEDIYACCNCYCFCKETSFSSYFS